ncbi:hypothetical protein N9E56_02775 [Flavobacteriaceae bacterium]|nr:hypothetical protein [Flavobacteriaceae bacterium]MDB4158002.1 hypothetical protein [bacterium]
MPKYKEQNGTTRVGDALRWLLKQGKEVAPELLKIASNVTGIEALELLANKIGADAVLSETDKKLLLEELNFDKIEMQETTKRWVSDNNTDSYLTRNIRPLTLAFLTATLFIYIILDSSLDGFKIAPEWIDLLSSLLLLVYGGYFGMRSAEKITKHFKK